jgi:hypothetical protein
MTITIAPFTIDSNRNLKAPPLGYGKEEVSYPPITYWGIYLDNTYIPPTSSKELAEKTKLWVEKWLTYRETDRIK